MYAQAPPGAGVSKRSSTRRWLDKHRNDPYVKAARAGHWRSRAVFKLSEIDEKDQLLRPGMTVVDLGCAPGGWSQYCASRLGGRGRIIGIDLLAMDALEGVEFLQADFAAQTGLQALEARLGDVPADLVLSDMAPNLSGVTVTDQMRVMHLAELTLAFCEDWLRPGGSLLVKVFQGEGFDELLQTMRRLFASTAVRKPDASRDGSREMYLLGKAFRSG